MNRLAISVLVAGCGVVLVPRALPAQCPANAVTVAAEADANEVYESCGVDTPARLRRRSALAYSRGRFSGDPVVAEVTFVVDTLGYAERATVRLTDPTSPELHLAVITAVMRQLYEPAVRQGRKVRQVATYAWMLYEGRPRDIDPAWRGSSVSTPPAYLP